MNVNWVLLQDCFSCFWQYLFHIHRPAEVLVALVMLVVAAPAVLAVPVVAAPAVLAVLMVLVVAGPPAGPPGRGQPLTAPTILAHAPGGR
jgi:hypothetical protein